MRRPLAFLWLVPFLVGPFLVVPFFSGGDARAEAPPHAPAVRIGRIVLRRDGAYRITRAQQALLGVEDPLRIDVRRHGRDVRLVRDVEVGGEAGCVVFAARDTAGPHSAFAVFEIWRRDESAPAGAPIGEAAPAAFPAERTLALDRVPGGLGAADPLIYDRDVPAWFLGKAPPGQTMPAKLGPRGAESGTPQRLVAHVYATWRGPVAMTATWNGHVLGRAEAALGVGGADLTWEVSAEAVPPAPAPLQLTNVSPAPPQAQARDVSAERGTVFVDAVRLEGAARPLNLWQDAAPVVVTKAGPRPDPLAAAGRARHIILAVPPLVAPARVLAAHRTQQGLPSVVIPVRDVYDRYGGGEQGPEAIRAYLRDLAARPDAPLDYVLLAGDAAFDRTDLTREVTIPAWFTRTKYNGATPSDARYLPPLRAGVPEPAIGRVPFRKPEELQAYVRRLIRYETAPPAHVSRRLLRFITSEGRFGPLLDKLIETKFRNVLTQGVPAAYDIEVTYANPRSPFLWPPPELSAKVVADLDDGALFFTYVGHGYEYGFDSLHVQGKRYGILDVRDVPQVAIRHTPPVVFVLACTTAKFDGVRGDGVGEALMKRPEGPVAYWGASRICHPVYNAFIGEAIARHLGRGGKERRLGAMLAAARADAPQLAEAYGRIVLQALKMLTGVKDLPRLFREGDAMYTLLGDPALRIAFPAQDVTVSAVLQAPAREVIVDVQADLPDGTAMHIALEVPRNRDLLQPEAVEDPSDPASFETIRRNHARVNERALERRTVVLKKGRALARFSLAPDVEAAGLVVKAWCIARGDVHQGAAILP